MVRTAAPIESQANFVRNRRSFELGFAVCMRIFYVKACLAVSDIYPK
jgi:hypothetical protein